MHLIEECELRLHVRGVRGALLDEEVIGWELALLPVDAKGGRSCSLLVEFEEENLLLRGRQIGGKVYSRSRLSGGTLLIQDHDDPWTFHW